MRNNIVHHRADELTYEIREIVEVGNRFEKLGTKMYWENIGDPVAKGQKIMPWIKDIVSDMAKNDDSCYGYSPTKGVLATREYIANMRNKEGGAQITVDDILFFNGLGDAIATIYTYLNQHSRVLGPSPAYSTHSSAESAHAESSHITYTLNPQRNWLPDLEDMRNKVKYNPAIAGILIINPDNPTGMVYPEAILRGIVDIAKEFDLFIISDEIYANIVYGEQKMIPLSKILDGVPGIAMKGLSKEVPWPGSRCGWIEVYNQKKDLIFARYVKTLLDAKMLEVCATTLPQKALPRILGDVHYKTHLKEVAQEYGKKADVLYTILRNVAGIIAPKPGGAFYASVVFEEGVLRNNQTLPIGNEQVRALVDEIVQNVPNDKRFVYYLMASTGICVVPLSGMNSNLDGFRVTLLEPDMERFEQTMRTLAESIKKYIRS
jgi:aspartate/methionine/tyrosine aminotransferase